MEDRRSSPPHKQRPSGSARSTGSRSIRVATAEDAPDLARLGRRLFEQSYAGAMADDDLRAYLGEAFATEIQRDELTRSGGSCILVEGDGGLIGFAQLWADPLTDANGNQLAGVELWRIYVDRAWQGRRVGRALLARVHAAAGALDAGGQSSVQAALHDGSTTRSGGAGLWLGVWEENSRAIAFYRKHGFRTVGERWFTVGGGRYRDLVMVCDRPVPMIAR